MRTRIGLIALALLAIAAFLGYWLPGERGIESWIAACLRIALVLGAAWLALPQLHEAPRWLVGTSVLLLVVLARWPRYFFLVLLAMIVAAMVKPRIAARRKG